MCAAHKATVEMFSLHEENKVLQQKIQDLEIELFLYQQQALLDQQLQVATEYNVAINSVKLQVGLINSEAKAMKLKTERKKQREKLHHLHIILTAQSMRYYNFQKLHILNHLDKCERMVNDLNDTLPFIVVNGVPAISDYHRSIDQWKMELQKSEQCLELLKKFCHQANSDLVAGNCTSMEQAAELFLHLKEPGDILHDNFIAAISSICSSYESTPNFISDLPQYYKVSHKETDVLSKTEVCLKTDVPPKLVQEYSEDMESLNPKQNQIADDHSNEIVDPAIILSYPIQENLVEASSSLNSQSPKSNLSVSNSSESLARPNFSKLCTYIKNKIPDVMETELLSALKAVRERYSKLTGLSKHTIVACVYAELYSNKHNRKTKASDSLQ